MARLEKKEATNILRVSHRATTSAYFSIDQAAVPLGFEYSNQAVFLAHHLVMLIDQSLV